jgi:signal recognition particle GTPase
MYYEFYDLRRIRWRGYKYYINLGNLTFTRILRIARGSGTSIEEVHILLDEHKKLSKVVGNLAKTNLGGKRNKYLYIGGNEFD